MVYLNALLFAVLVAVFSWEEDRALHLGSTWQVLLAGLGWLLALALLLSTLRRIYPPERR
ncbi:hypothetical protein [Deinococcus sp. YIM 77859]|uniref:hypothetical protein n=1 Tax=Deinococcus sp. YIM 77859 TaxID=1540221 RepID=UPI000554AD8E|nr:hypothetical protein [Deinococcus sp. YIM 77859]